MQVQFFVRFDLPMGATVSDAYDLVAGGILEKIVSEAKTNKPIGKTPASSVLVEQKRGC